MESQRIFLESQRPKQGGMEWNWTCVVLQVLPVPQASLGDSESPRAEADNSVNLKKWERRSVEYDFQGNLGDIRSINSIDLCIDGIHRFINCFIGLSIDLFG